MTAKETTIWNELNKKLWNFIYSKTGDRDMASDLFQETYLKVHTHIGSLKDEKKLASWIFSIARNMITDHYREQQKPLPVLENSEEEQSLNARVECCIIPFINRLPEKYREALLMSEIDQVSQKELAERLQISYSGLKSRVQRGREKLKEEILNCCLVEADRYGNIMDIAHRSCNTECEVLRLSVASESIG